MNETYTHMQYFHVAQIVLIDFCYGNLTEYLSSA